MTPALIAALVISAIAFLACIIALRQKDHQIEYLRDVLAGSDANAATERVTARQRAETDARLLADAWALLHDEKRRGKLANHEAWLVARSEWCERWRGQ